MKVGITRDTMREVVCVFVRVYVRECLNFLYPRKFIVPD